MNRVTPETFETVAHELYRAEEIESGERDNGFVYTSKPFGPPGALVGIETGDQHIVARMTKSSEVIGRNDPKIQTSENEFVRAEFYEVDLDDTSDPSEIDRALDRGARKIDTGYVHGYRVTPIEDVLSETFKYYSFE